MFENFLTAFLSNYSESQFFSQGIMEYLEMKRLDFSNLLTNFQEDVITPFSFYFIYSQIHSANASFLCRTHCCRFIPSIPFFMEFMYS